MLGHETEIQKFHRIAEVVNLDVALTAVGEWVESVDVYLTEIGGWQRLKRGLLAALLLSVKKPGRLK